MSAAREVKPDHGTPRDHPAPSMDDIPAAGKALAVFLYNVGAFTLEDCQRTFQRHREWRSA